MGCYGCHLLLASPILKLRILLSTSQYSTQSEQKGVEVIVRRELEHSGRSSIDLIRLEIWLISRKSEKVVRG